MKVQNKAIVVTGGGNGIGRELVLRLLDKGARVAAVDINEAGLQETAALASAKKERLSLHIANIADRSAVEALPASDPGARRGSSPSKCNRSCQSEERKTS